MQLRMSGRDTAVALLTTVVWGLNFVVIRWGLGEWPPLFFAGLRFAAVAFPAVFLIGRGNMPWKLILATGSFVGVGYFSLLFVGMQLGMPPGLSALVSQAQVLFTALFSVWMLGQRPTIWQWLGMAVAGAGLYLSAGNSLALAPLSGFVLVLLAALFWGLGNIMMKKLGGPIKVDGFRLTIWMSLVPILPNLLLSFWTEQGQWTALSGITWMGAFAVLYTAWASTILGWGAWAWLLRKYAAPQVAPFSLLVPVVTLIIAVGLGMEPLTVETGLAAALLLGGVALTIFGDRLGGALGGALGGMLRGRGALSWRRMRASATEDA
ncbi:EamA family transporter [Megalodesulfovibrio paquesii]